MKLMPLVFEHRIIKYIKRFPSIYPGWLCDEFPEIKTWKEANDILKHLETMGYIGKYKNGRYFVDGRY